MPKHNNRGGGTNSASQRLARRLNQQEDPRRVELLAKILEGKLIDQLKKQGIYC